MKEYIVNSDYLTHMIGVHGELVRCKDCKHFALFSNQCQGACDNITDRVMHINWFCADGERKDDKGEQDVILLAAAPISDVELSDQWNI